MSAEEMPIGIDLSDQVVGCCHPDCLSLAEFMAAAFWNGGTTDFFQAAPTCLSHVGWSVQLLICELERPGQPRIAVVRIV